MSQYGFKNCIWAALHFDHEDTSGFTFTINPLSTPGIGDPFGYGSPLEVNNLNGSSGTYSMLNDSINPYKTYLENDPSISLPSELNAATPIFWCLHIHEVTNPRFAQLLTSNNSGTGTDVRFYLVGSTGRYDTSTNWNRSRTSDCVFLRIDSQWFTTANATPFTTGTLLTNTGVGSLGTVSEVMSSALSPYNWLTNGDGTPSGSAATGPTATSMARAKSRTFITKHPTLSYQEGAGNAFTITDLVEEHDSFDLYCEVYYNGGWQLAGSVDMVLAYRSSLAHYVGGSFGGANDAASFPGNCHVGAYTDWYGTLHNGLTFNYAATSGFTGGAAWGANADYTSWTSAFAGSAIDPEKGFPVLLRSNIGKNAGSVKDSDVYKMFTEDRFPAYLFSLSPHHDQTCGSYLDNYFTLTSGTGKNWDTHQDDEAETGSVRKAIFGYKASQGLMDLYNSSCNHTTTSISNTTSNDQLRFVDQHEFWYAFSPQNYWNAADDTTGPGNPRSIAPNSYVYNQPMCGNKTEWETQIIHHEYIPAPIWDPNLNEHYWIQVRPNNTWNVPTGVEAIELLINPNYAATSTYQPDQNGWTFAALKTNNNGNCTNAQFSWVETKSQCTLQDKNHIPTAALEIDDFSVTTVDATCWTNGNGSLEFTFNWRLACNGAFYNMAPDDYAFDVIAHFSLNNTGSVTHSITIPVTSAAMGWNPAAGTGSNSGQFSAAIQVPCGDYYNHSIEVTPMTSTTFTTGQVGDSHTWVAGSGGNTWANYSNTNNNVGCPPNPPTMGCTPTNAGCSSLGSVNFTWGGGTPPYTMAVVDGSGTNIYSQNMGSAISLVVSGLSAGVYTGTLVDSNGCADTCTSTILNQGGNLTVSESAAAPTHCVLPNGSVSLGPTGGTGPYSVVWTEAISGTVLPGTGLNLNPCPSGDYSYVVTDANGCTASGTVTVPAAPALGMSCAPATIGLDPSGSGLSDGIVQISIQNTTGFFGYNAGIDLNLVTPSVCIYDSTGTQIMCDNTWAPWNDFYPPMSSPSNIQVTGLPADTYTIKAYYTPNVGQTQAGFGMPIEVPAATACELVCTVTLTDPGSTASCTSVVTDESCIGGDGTIQITATGGSTNAFHHWDFTLCTDAAMTIGCQTFTGTSTFGDNTTGNVHTFMALPAGTYYATVTPCFGVNGLTCLSPSAIIGPLTVGSPAGPNFTITPTHPTCALACDGSFIPNVSGGTAPYVYQYNHPATGWTPPGGAPWSSFTTTGHCAVDIQNEEFAVIDANGCTSTAFVTLIDPPPVDFTQAPGPPPHPTVSPATCGANDGSVTFSLATGGTITPPHTTFQYDLYNSSGVIVQTLGAGNTGSVVPQWINVLAADTYTLRATDSNGCYEEITFTVNTATFTVAVNFSDQGCTFPPSNDGTLQLVVSPYANVPVPNYTYVWTHAPSGTVIQNETIAGTTSTQLTGLAADIYNWSVTDGNGCVVTGNQTISLSADTQENVAVTEIGMACPTGCGLLQISNTTGDFPLYVEISDDGGATWTRVSTNPSSSATAFTSIDLAPPGIQVDQNSYYQENTTNRFCFNMGSTYHIRTFSQANSCPSVPVVHTMSNTAYIPMVFTEVLTQPTCCGCNNSACNGSITNVITNGVPIAQGVAGSLMSYNWTLTHDGTVIAQQNGAAVFGGGVVSSTQGSPTNEQFDTITFSGLYPGTYVFEATDECNETHSETWVLIDPRIYVTDIVTSHPLCLYGCDDGTITVTASGGDSGTYQFSMDDGITWQPPVASSNTSYTFTGVGPGTWNIWARDPSCGTQILFDPTDNVLTTANGCYSDFITGIWPAGTQSTLTPVSDLNTQWVSTTNNSLPGSSDGAIEINILGGTAPYEVSVLTSANAVVCDGCALQTAGVIPAGLSQYIDLNGVAVSNTGITSIASNGSLIIDNLSVSLDFSGTALGAWYTIYVKDASGCFSCISKYIDNGTLGIIGIYAADDCNCNCPDGYSLISPPPPPPAPACAGTTPVAPTFIGAFNAPNSIQQFGAANLTAAGYGNTGGVLYVPAGGNANLITAVSTADTFVKTDLGGIPSYPGQFISPGSGTVLEAALDAALNVQTYGSIFNSRLWDIGIWPQHPPTNPAMPTNEWIGVPVEIDFASAQSCILGITADGNYKVTLDCGMFLTSEDAVNSNAQTVGVDALNYQEYAMIPVLIPEGKHTLTFWVKNSTVNASADQIAGIGFDLFQGVLNSGLSVTSVFVGATTQAQLDPYYLLDVNGKKITSRDITNNSYDHDFLMGDTNGYQCASDCLYMDGGNITCLSDDTAECTLPINCPEYLSDLVECVGTLSNEVYTKMISGLLENKLDIREVWLVLLTKYLIKNLNPCVTLQDLLSWAKFLEDVCPDCENNFEGTRPALDPNEGTPYGGGDGINTYDF